MKEREKKMAGTTTMPDLRSMVTSTLNSRQGVELKINQILNLVEQQSKSLTVADALPVGRADLRSANSGNGTVLDRGQHSLCLTHGEVLKKRKQDEEKKIAEAAEKIRKADEAQKKRAENQRAREKRAAEIAKRKE